MAKSLNKLSRRERQIMELVYQKGEVTVADIQEAIPDQLSYSSIRAQMTILERKGFLRHRQQGRAYLYCPTLDRARASRAALKQVVNTFFDGSVGSVVSALISERTADLTDEDLDKLDALIRSAREKGGQR